MLAWGLTYLVHSSLLIGAVWLLSRRLGDRPLALDRLWKLALVGGVITASIQTAAGLSPAALELGSGGAVAAAPAAKPVEVRWHIDLPAEPVAKEGPAPVKKAADAEPQDENRTRGAGDGEPGTGDEAAAGALAGTAPGSGSESGSGSGSAPGSGSGSGSGSRTAPGSGSVVGSAAAGLELGVEAWKWVVLLAGIVSVLLAMRLWLSWFRLRRILSDRRVVVTGAAPAILAELEERAGMRRRVRLSATSRLEVPIAIGVLRPEICVPHRALEELDAAELETMLAHELAHLVRRDPAWRLLAGLVCRVFFFQPLNRLAASRIETASEMLCDDWAVEHTDRPLALARCLTEVAGWIAAPALDGSPVPAMARGGSGLGRRVRRLLAAGDGVPGAGRRERWFVPLGAGLVALLVFAAPGATDTAPRPTRAAPPVPPVPPVPAAAPVPPAVQTVPHRPVQGDLRRLLTQLRSGQPQSQDVGDWIALAQALGSPDNTANLAQIFHGGLDLDLDVDIDVDVSPDGSIDIHIRPKGAPAPDPDPDHDDGDPNFFDFDFDFDHDFDFDFDADHDDDDDDADDEDDDDSDESDEDGDEDEDEDDDDDGDCSGHDIHIPDIDVHVPHIDRDQIREMKRQAKEMARQAREQALEAARQAREQARQAREQAHEAARHAREQARDAARQAHEQAEQVRQHVEREMERARREIERAQREQHEALREAWRQMRKHRQNQHGQRFAVPPPPPVPPVPPRAPRPPKAPAPPAPPAPVDPFDADSN